MTQEIVATLNIKRDSKFLWVLGTNEQGYLTVIKVTRGKQGRPRKNLPETLQNPSKSIEKEDYDNRGFKTPFEDKSIGLHDGVHRPIYEKSKEIKQEEEINWDE